MVEGHHDVRAIAGLELDRTLWAEDVRCAVEVRLERRGSSLTVTCDARLYS
jgi:hypothetical protein